MTRARIVVVEDDEGIRLVTRIALENLGGHEVTMFASGEEAIAAAPSLAPDLLILDVSMPGLDGPQTLERLRQVPALAGTRAVFFTASTRPSQVTQLRRLGALDVIAKPFDPRHLCERVAIALKTPLDATAAPVGGGDGAAARRVALVVEDDAGVRYLLRFILEQQGWDVREATSGPEGLHAIEDGSLCDVVLLDIMLPGVDGLELLDVLRARQRWSGVPVMMLTARGDESAMSRALARGANDYLSKPFDPAEFTQRLQRLLQAG